MYGDYLPWSIVARGRRSMGYTSLCARIEEEGEERGVGGCRVERLSVVGVVAVAVLAAGVGGSGPGWWQPWPSADDDGARACSCTPVRDRATGGRGHGCLGARGDARLEVGRGEQRLRIGGGGAEGAHQQLNRAVAGCVWRSTMRSPLVQRTGELN